MKDLTPKKVARAIQVSESSVKRWCDKGIIETYYTAGGHRRISLSSLLDFVRDGNYTLVRPEIVGLPATSGQSTRVIDRAVPEMLDGLVQGDEERCRQIVLDLYLAEHSVSTICDQVFAPCFVAIGDKWECGDAEVYQERRGCEIALRVLNEIRTFVGTPPADGNVAIGGAPEGDQYNLATTMAEIVLRDTGWRATSLGDNLPFATLHAAIQEQRPKLFWLSCSHLEDPDQFLNEYRNFFDEFGTAVAIVVGGRALTEPIRQDMRYAAFCDNMQHLESFANTLSGMAARNDG